MNVIFLSPNFPEHFFHFCEELKKVGARVLGIGDAPYDSLNENLRNSLEEYYYVPSLEDYDAVYRAVGHFIGRWGRIDYVESQNEYWLELEAKLRDDFNIRTGFSVAELESVKRKSQMKRFYRAAGIPTARYRVLDSDESLDAFARQVGFPIVVKPDSGVGASDTWKLNDPAALETFRREKKRGVSYIAEEFVDGRVETFDGVVNARGEILFATGQVMLVNPLEMASRGAEAVSYTANVRETGIYDVGSRAVKAFGLRSKFFHLEFFRLLKDRENGKAGDIWGLEANMRAPGGYIPDKMNYSHDVDVYRIWAEMLAYQERRTDVDVSFKFHTTHVGRRDGVQYAHSVDEIRARYGDKLKLVKAPPKALNGTMGSQIFLLRSRPDGTDELKEQCKFILARADGSGWSP